MSAQQHPAIEGRALMEDPRFPGYVAFLEAERKKYDHRLRSVGCDPRVMDRCAGAIEALDLALQRPAVMKTTLSSPQGDNPPSSP